MKFRIAYAAADPITMRYLHAQSSYDAFKTAVDLMGSGQALECIVYIADGDEWVKLSNVRFA